MLKRLFLSLSMVTLIYGQTYAASPDQSQSLTNPVPGVEMGKVKTISIDKLTPTVRNMVEADLGKNSLSKNQRFAEIPDDAVLYMKNYHANIKDMRVITKNTTFKLSSLENTAFEKYGFEGAYPEGPTKAGPWSSLTRVFKREDGVLMMLHEWDYVHDGGGIMVVNELMNAKVNGSPARFSVKRSPSGWIVSELMWATKKRFYTLTVMDDVVDADNVKYNVKWMNALANSLR